MADIVERARTQTEVATEIAAGLTPADLEAIQAYLAPRLDRLEQGLGAAVCGYVLQGGSDSVLARIPRLRGVPHFHNSLSSLLGYETKPDVRRVFLEAHSWDRLVVRRLGEVLAAAARCGGYARRWPGSAQSPDYLRALTHVLVMLLQERAVHSGSWLLSGPRCLDLLSLDGGDQAQLVDVVFAAFDRDYYRQGRSRLPSMSALARALAGAPARALQAARGLDEPGRLEFMAFLGQTELSARPEFVEHLLATAAHGAGAGRRESEAALEALAGCDRELQMEAAARLLASEVPARRLTAARLLRRIATPAAGALLAKHMEGEMLNTVQEEMREALWELNVLMDDGQRAYDVQSADGEQGYVAIDGRWIAIPPVAPLPPEAELPEGLAQGLREAIDQANREANPKATTGYELYSAVAAGPFLEALKYELYSAASAAAIGPLWGTGAVERLAATLRKTGPRKDPREVFQARARYRCRLFQLLSQPGITPQHLARALRLDPGEAVRGWAAGQLVDRASMSIPARLLLEHAQRLGDFRTVLLATAPRVCSENLMGELLRIRPHRWARVLREPRGALLWPLVAEHLPMLDQVLGVTPAAVPPAGRRSHALALLCFLPAPPRRYLPVFTQLAVRGRPEERRLARKLLAGTPGLQERLAALLKSSGGVQRSIVAAWLGERGERWAIPALRAALEVEKLMTVRAHLRAALVVLGDDVSDLLSEERLLQEARAVRAIRRRQLDRCVPLDGLPQLAWADGRPVPVDLVRWLIVLANRLRQPRGNAFLDLLVERLDEASAERLGQLVLASFVSYDTRHPSDEEASAYAAARAEREVQALRGPLWTQEALRQRREELFAAHKAAQAQKFLHDGHVHRGILALSPRVEPSALVNVAATYLKAHPRRARQCQALLDTLAHHGSASALQLLAWVAGRYRRRYQRQHANALLEGIAQQRGWSREELEDRAIPAGGLADGGILTLESPRGSYTARLDSELQLVVRNPQGRPVKGLPAGSPGRKRLLELKKQLNQTITRQTARLNEAMCVERRWRPEELQFLLRHPIAGRLCEWLIFLGLGPQGERLETFRPLGDGTLSDRADRGVELSQFAAIRLAHRAVLDEEEVSAWQQHLQDYRIVPLFEQLGRPLLRVDEGQAHDRAITEREGWMVDSETLAAQAVKRGYQLARGGQGFKRYEKPFPSLGLTAVIDFAGAQQQARNAPCALLGLRIEGADNEEGAPLSSVPVVLLSEAWNDLRDIAAAGSGFDRQWRGHVF